MQLVDEGKLDLDAPVVDVLPELELADRGRRRAGHDAPPAHAHERHRRRRLHRHRPRRRLPREATSRCSRRPRRTTRSAPRGRTATPASSLAGRVIEKLTGGTWDAAIQERLVAPARPDAHRAPCPRRRCSTAPPSATSSENGAEPERAAAWALPRVARAGRPDQLDRRRCAHVCAHAPDRRPRARRHADPERGERRRP